MSPSHAAKDGRRWRYYVSQALLLARRQEAGSLARAPAIEIERQVTEAVRAALSAADRQRSALHGATGSGAPTNLTASAVLRAIDQLPEVQRETVLLVYGEGYTYAEAGAALAIPLGNGHEPRPDVTNCGGITPFMKIAHLAEAHNLPVTSHGAHDVTVHLLAAVSNRSYLEAHGFGLESYLAQPLEIQGGFAIAPERPGHGIEFDWEKLAALAN
jgi:Enolase C-terminal domain-like/Sigma-70, region 4